MDSPMSPIVTGASFVSPFEPAKDDKVGHSVISYDYGFCSRMDDGSDKLPLPCLVMHDRDTRLLGVIPTLQKGGKHLQYVVTEFVRFIMHTQHRELALRSDLEPTNLAILDGVRKTCRGANREGLCRWQEDLSMFTSLVWMGSSALSVGS